MTFENLQKYAVKNGGEPKIQSGRQEMLENHLERLHQMRISKSMFYNVSGQRYRVSGFAFCAESAAINL